MAICYFCSHPVTQPLQSVIGGEVVSFCQYCYKNNFTNKKKVGRPSKGVTKKVSLTLLQSDWDEVEKRSKNNKSNYLRKIILKDLMQSKSKSQAIFFKDIGHENYTELLLEKFDTKNLYDNRNIGAFCYLTSGIGKAGDILYRMENGKLNVKKLYEVIERFSSDEKRLIRLSLQLLDPKIDNITISEVLSSLDKIHSKIALQALAIRFQT